VLCVRAHLLAHGARLGGCDASLPRAPGRAGVRDADPRSDAPAYQVPGIDAPIQA